MKLIAISGIGPTGVVSRTLAIIRDFEDRKMAATTVRPARGEDIIALQRRLGVTRQDMMWVLGYNTASYMKATADGRAPLQMPMAMVVRLLQSRPDLSPIPVEPSVQEFYDLCVSIDPAFTSERLAILMGRASATAYRWLNGGNPRMTKGARRWMLLMWWALTRDTGKASRAEVLSRLWTMVLDEAEARGYDRNILEHTGRWQIIANRGERKLPTAVGAAVADAPILSKPRKKAVSRKKKGR